MFVYFSETEKDRAWAGEGQRERHTHRIWSRLPAPSCEHRAQCGAWTHESWDHDLNWSWTPNRLSHPTPLTSIILKTCMLKSLNLCFMSQIFSYTFFFRCFHIHFSISVSLWWFVEEFSSLMICSLTLSHLSSFYFNLSLSVSFSFRLLSVSLSLSHCIYEYMCIPYMYMELPVFQISIWFISSYVFHNLWFILLVTLSFLSEDYKHTYGFALAFIQPPRSLGTA